MCRLMHKPPGGDCSKAKARSASKRLLLDYAPGCSVARLADGVISTSKWWMAGTKCSPVLHFSGTGILLHVLQCTRQGSCLPLFNFSIFWASCPSEAKGWLERSHLLHQLERFNVEQWQWRPTTWLTLSDSIIRRVASGSIHVVTKDARSSLFQIRNNFAMDSLDWI